MTPEILLVILCLLTLLLFVAAGAILWLARTAISLRSSDSISAVADPSEDAQEAPSPIAKAPDSKEFRAQIERDFQLYEAKLKSDIEQRARVLIWAAMSKSAVSTTGGSTTDAVSIPSDDIKGKIIGKEGKNIRAFESAAGVDLLVDERPGAIVVSSFDAMRRAIACRALETLIQDGRIQPARIEESIAEAKRLIESESSQLGRDAAKQAQVNDLAPKILAMLGKLQYRTSLGQNVLQHSIECAQMASAIAAELGINAVDARKAALLHDIGKALGPEYTESHALAGMRFLKECGLAEPILNAVGAHHGEIVPTSPESEIVAIVDAMSASRPGARSEPLDSFFARMDRFESIARAMPGVKDVFAVQGGRELRVIVSPESLDDLGCRELALDLTTALQTEAQSFGEIHVTVIREYRTSSSTKSN